jgi:cysteinyl-tRNA synthetase
MLPAPSAQPNTAPAPGPRQPEPRLPATPLVLGGTEVALLDRARIYACGITPYDVTHLGHAATFVWVDVLARVLRDRGVTPVVARNVTDVDDVLSEAAARAGTHYDQFAYLQQYDFDRDMAALGVRRPDHEPRARHHVGNVVALAAALLERGAAYEQAGGVYFPGSSVAAEHGLTESEALRLAEEYGGRTADPAKRHPLDAAVWQPAAPGELAWESPWGPGRPGWHAECAAMAVSTFGPSLDLHAGGADLRFPHHAFEAAMAQALTGVRPYARAWLQVGVVRLDGQKMAKSAGNLTLVHDVLADQPAAVLRLLLVHRRWAEAWDYHPDLLGDAARLLGALRAAADRTGDPAGEPAVRAALSHDLDVPAAVAEALRAGGAGARLLLDLLGLAGS